MEASATWKIVASGCPDAQAVDHLGSRFLIGNGYLGYRGTLEEYTKEQKTATIIAGLYDRVGKQWREPVNWPNGGFVQVFYRGEPLHVLSSRVIEHRQELNLREAIHERRTLFETGDGTRILVQARRFASLARLPLICLEYTVSADQNCHVILRSGIDGDVWDLNGPHLRESITLEEDDCLSLLARTHEQDIPIAVSVCMNISSPASSQSSLNAIYRDFSVFLRAHEPFTLYKFIAHSSGLENTDPWRQSQQICRQAARLGFEKLLEEHRHCWLERWARSDIQIEGDETAQLALRFSLYHLLSIAPTHTDHISIPARGLSGQTYKGAIFWDTEIFMLPFFLYTFPEIARNLLRYRYHMLEGARRKAVQYGYRGAFYAWESQENGDDACTLFNITDVFTNRPIRTYFRDKQIHISADIVYAIWQYVSVTGDDSLLLDGGAEVVFECARFYLSAIYYRVDKKRYEILDVTGPDEYHERVHNNFYTNRMIAHTFAVCKRVADYLKIHYPETFETILTRLDFAADLALIEKMIPEIYLPSPDPERRVIPQFDGYLTLEDVSVTDLLARKQHPHEYLGGGQGLATTTQVIKQADVVLALCLFPDDFDEAIKAANWDYYELRTEHGSSLSACAYAQLAARIGRPEQAYHYFLQTAMIDLQEESKQYVGTLYIGGTHPAANGGAWWSLVQGLCGLSFAEGTLVLQPCLPAHWRRVSIPLTLHGQHLHLMINHQEVRVQVDGLLSHPLTISIAGTTCPLPPHGTLTIPLAAEGIHDT
jgi:trehalose/maltose hydrolase-like predicted phosphorylase